MVKMFFIAFCLACNPGVRQELTIQATMERQIMQNMKSPASAFKAIPNTIPANLFRNCVAKRAEFVLPPIDSVLLAAILGVYLHTWLKK